MILIFLLTSITGVRVGGMNSLIVQKIQKNYLSKKVNISTKSPGKCRKNTRSHKLLAATQKTPSYNDEVRVKNLLKRSKHNYSNVLKYNNSEVHLVEYFTEENDGINHFAKFKTPEGYECVVIHQAKTGPPEVTRYNVGKESWQLGRKCKK